MRGWPLRVDPPALFLRAWRRRRALRRIVPNPHPLGEEMA